MSTEHAAHNWIRVTRETPCPICDKPDNCSVSRDGEMAWCGRVSEGAIKENAGGQYLHRLRGGLGPSTFHPPAQVRRSTRRDYAGLAARLFADGETERRTLARTLGVQEQALEQLQVGWNRWERYWSFPERDAAGKVIGISARYLDGTKKRLPGSHAGLTYAIDWDAGEGPILLVEGGSDTAALLGMGMSVIGRPSNLGGVKFLTDLLRPLPPTRAIIVVGERDEKADGSWPGRDGAVKTAQRLSVELDREFKWSLPPDNAKDARAWLQTIDGLPFQRTAALFLAGLSDTIVRPPPKKPVATALEEIPLPEWREVMLQARTKALDRPGCYPDASATGAGKSHVDFSVIRRLLAEESA